MNKATLCIKLSNKGIPLLDSPFARRLPGRIKRQLQEDGQAFRPPGGRKGYR